MALITFFLFTIFSASTLPPTSSTTSLHFPHSTNQMLIHACANLHNQTSCLKTLDIHVRRDLALSPSTSVMRAIVRASLHETRLLIHLISTFQYSLLTTHRERLAVHDCKELLGFSASELRWSLLEMRNIASGYHYLHSQGNLKAWLSAALSNQDTCLEGFEGTDGRLEKSLRKSMNHITQLVSNILSLYTDLHSVPFSHAISPTDATQPPPPDSFPPWMTKSHKEFLKTSHGNIHPNVIVAIDGSGDYKTITEAIRKAPDYVSTRYVIYVKKGTYTENIDLKKKKTNIMLLGDGQGETIVTGDRSFSQGWTTFRTATVGKPPIKTHESNNSIKSHHC